MNLFIQTDFSTQEDGKIKIATVNKKLNRKIYSNGEVVDSYSMVAHITQSFTIIGTGSKEETGTSGSTTVRLAVGFDYEKATPDGGVTFCYKVTKIYATPTLLDSSFTITNLYQSINGSGVGYDASGNPVMVSEGVKSYNISYPTSGTKYSLNTGYRMYIIPVSGSGVATSATLTYIRSSTGNSYTYTYSVSVGG